MKNYMKKIFTGVMTLALVLGFFLGTDTTEVKAASIEMPVYVKNIKTGEPVANIYLMLESQSDDAENIIFDEPTDENGYVLYEPLTLKSGVTYLLKPAADSDCTTNEEIEVVGGRGYYGNYIDTVDGEDYTGWNITLFVQDNRDDKPVISEISSIASSIEEIGADGGNATITVNGKNLPDEAYCQLWYETQTGVQGEAGDLQTMTMTGNAGEKEFSISIPSASAYPGAVRWIVRVSLDENGTQGWDSVRIAIR